MKPDNDKANILVVDDEPSIRLMLESTLRDNYDVTTAADGREALQIVAKSVFDLILLDIRMPDVNGLDLLDAVKREQPLVAVIMLTGFGSVDTAVRTMKSGATNYLQKPASPDEILESVSDGLAAARRERQRTALLQRAREFVQAGLEQLEQVMPESVDLVAEENLSEEPPDPDRFLTRGPLVADTYRRVATLNGELLDLTAGEYDLLLCLASHAPRVLDPQEIVLETRGFECSLLEAREIVRWQVYLLRQKVEPDPSNPTYLLNVRGRGYMWAGA